MRADLSRPHAFAFERVGFARCRYARTPSGTVLGLIHDYFPVADEDYIEDASYGALIGSNAFRKAMQLAYNSKVGMLHVHMHPQTGVPVPSKTDLRETSAFVPDFFHVQPSLPHGALILSWDSLSCRLWSPNDQTPHTVHRLTVVGMPLQVVEQKCHD